MITRKQKEQYYRDGFLLIPNVLTLAEVAWLRAFFRPKFETSTFLGDTHHCLLDLFGRHPEVRWLAFHRPTIKLVRALLGEDIVLLPDSTIHYNYFGGWHKDTGTYDLAGCSFLEDKNYEQCALAYYLQDNTEEYGGGLDVEPGSHHDSEDLIIRPPALRERRLYKKIWHEIYRPGKRKYWRTWEEYVRTDYVPKNLYSIPSLAGDLILFDSRLTHHATPPGGIVPDGGMVRRGVLPAEHEKLAIFTAYSRNNDTARAYVEWNRTRKEYPHLIDFSYPADFLKDAEKADVKLVY